MSFADDFDEMAAVVQAAEDEIIMAAMFHETWKPAAFDLDLRARMGKSFATHSFNIVRIALRREMIMALMRIWDSNKESVRMTAIAEKLKENIFFKSLAAKRAADLGMRSNDDEDRVIDALEPQRKAVLSLIRKYSEGGSGYSALEKIRTLRNERLAHRQVSDISTVRDNIDDKEVDAFYNDSLAVVTQLLSLVLARAFNLNEAGDVYGHHARFFWASVRGERTEGHPNYRKPIG